MPRHSVYVLTYKAWPRTHGLARRPSIHSSTLYRPDSTNLLVVTWRRLRVRAHDGRRRLRAYVTYYGVVVAGSAARGADVLRDRIWQRSRYAAGWRFCCWRCSCLYLCAPGGTTFLYIRLAYASCFRAGMPAQRGAHAGSMRCMARRHVGKQCMPAYRRAMRLFFSAAVTLPTPFCARRCRQR